MSNFVLKYFESCQPDWQAFIDEIKELMDSPTDFFVNHPNEAKSFCVLISTIQLIALLLAPSYFGTFLTIWIGFASFILSAVTALLSQSIKDQFALLPFVQFLSNGMAKWKHVQFTISLFLTSANFISIILQIALATKFTVYLFAAILSILLFAAYSIESLASLRIDDGTGDERTPVAEEARVV